MKNFNFRSSVPLLPLLVVFSRWLLLSFGPTISLLCLLIWVLPSGFTQSIPDEWRDIGELDSTIVLDLRYATSDNFTGEKWYSCARCLLRPEVADALLAAHRELVVQGLGLKLYDCYRPLPVQQKLWDKMPDARYVTPPQKGSMHNRGAAIDVTLVDKEGKELNMGTVFDFFGEKAYHTSTGHPKLVLDNRLLLKKTLESHGFRAIRTEWWHYSYTLRSYPLSKYQWPCP